MPPAAIALLTLQLAFEPPEVRAAGACPSAADVAALLVPLLPTVTDERRARPDVAELTEGRGELRVLLRDSDGAVVHERVLAAGATCAERARAAAAILAAWESDLHADVAFPSTPAPPPQEPAPAPEPEAPAEPPETSADEPEAPAAEPPPVAVASAPSAGPGDATSGRHVTVGGELFAAAPGGGSAAPAGSVEVTWSLGDRFHGRLAFLVTGEHAVSLTPGEVDWRRAAFVLGGVVDLTRGRVAVQGRADAIGAAVLAQGTGFSVDQRATSWQLGADIGGRAGVSLTPRLAIWADLALALFPGSQRFSVQNAGTAPSIPGTEVQAGVGLSFSLAR